MPERRLAAYAEAVQLLRGYAKHDHDCRPATKCTCGWAEIRPEVDRLIKVAAGADECPDCGGSGWRVVAGDELRRCHCNPEPAMPAYVNPDDAQPARLSGGTHL